MSNNNDMKTEVIIPGNEKNDKMFLIVYKELSLSSLICYIYYRAGECAGLVRHCDSEWRSVHSKH